MSPEQLRIAVNLTWLAPGRVGGSEEYLVRQLTGIAQGAGGSDVDLQLHLYCQRPFIDAHPTLTDLIHTTSMPIERDLRGARIAVENTWLPTVTRGADVIHHGGGTAPFINRRPMVLTVHDLQYLSYPQYFSTARRTYLTQMMPRSIRAATVVATPSQYVRDRVIDVFGADPDTVQVVRHGVPPAAIPDPQLIEAARRRYGVAGPYLAYAAITHPHKGHARLVEVLAMTQAPSHPLHELRLVLIGGVGAAEDELARAIARCGVGDRIVRTGRVPASDRDALIAGAQALVFPSEYEGFGAPLVEAMALDVPVVASDHPAVVEVVADAGVIVGSSDPAAWAEGIERALADRSQLIAAGRTRREEFTVEQSGAELGRAYRIAAGVERPVQPNRAQSTGQVEHVPVQGEQAQDDQIELDHPEDDHLGDDQAGPMKIIVLCPHFAPDTAPTGTVMTRIVDELVNLGNTVHVVTALPWYRRHRIEPGWGGALVRDETTEWGTITRVSPFPGDDKRNLLRRALGFIGFSALAGWAGLRAGGWFARADAVLAMSPPLTLGLTGRLVAVAHRAPLVFNIQDVFPDAAVKSGALGGSSRVGRAVVAAAELLERVSYRQADAVTVLSDDLADNVTAKIGDATGVHVIPNFARTDLIEPSDRMTEYRRDLGIGPELVVLYAGNVGFSQSLDLVVAAARARPQIAFVVNGEGAARPEVDQAAAELANLYVSDYQPVERLAEVLATGDIHVVPLKAGLGDVSVPSKTYSSLAAGRPVVAAIDADTAIPMLLHEAQAGLAVPPDEIDAFIEAIDTLADDAERRADAGRQGRAWVDAHASPEAVGAAYHGLFARLRRAQRRRKPSSRRPSVD